MPRTGGKKKQRAGRASGDADADAAQLNPLRAGMPSPDSVIGVEQMVRGGKVYRIIKTDEVDAYEEPTKARRRRGAKR